MQCQECGAKLEGEARFCDACGEPLETASAVMTPVLSPSPAAAAQLAPVPGVSETLSIRPLPPASYSPKWNNPATAESHWHRLIRGLELSPLQFYALVRQAVESRHLPEVWLATLTIREGGIFSAKREYLRVWRKELQFDICGAPFGDAFFVSWWLGTKPPGCLALLFFIPFVLQLYQRFLRPWTYYEADTAAMFRDAIHDSVTDVLDSVMKAKGLRLLSELERKPINREFFRR